MRTKQWQGRIWIRWVLAWMEALREGRAVRELEPGELGQPARRANLKERQA